MKTLQLNSELIIYKRILTFLGVWPMQNNAYFKLLQLCLVVFSQISLTIPQFIDLYFNWRDMDNTIENLTCTVVVIMVVIKLITLTIHKESMAACVRLVIEDWSLIKNIESYKIMKSHLRAGKIVLIGLSLMLYFTYILYIILAVVITTSTDCNELTESTNLTIRKRCKVLPVRTTNYITNTEHSPLYEILFLVQTIQGMMTCTGNYGIDAFMFYLTMHICAQLEILKIDFRSLINYTNSMQSWNTKDIELYQKRIKDLTIRHYKLISFSEHLEKTFNIMILGQLLTTSVMICVIGFQFILSLENGDFLSAGKYMIYVLAVMMQLLLYSYAGDYLQSQSLGLAYAVYESPWYDLPPSLALDLLFVMIRSGKPLRISAGKFFVMTLESFKVIMKTSGSYLSLLRVMVN